ncbi:Major Facilitator Superfamily protein [Actinacidiphila cocklensis]|uniref:Major Facilitator Superfamily protein n=2 Tax=Actinacidiphila cocklensis TaxID=887465 RepID=A0A9W4GRG8_9ACTN|nr:Major Facilitator Superfamily protein [Actinacidiphila cocklensis]
MVQSTMGPVTSSAPRSEQATAPSAPSYRPPAGPLWSTPFRLYFTARSVAMLGDTMLPVALSAGLLSYGYSAGDIGLVMAAASACFAGFVIFGGVLADRLNARALMIGSDLVRVGTQSTAAVLFLTHSVRLWEVLVIALVNGTCAATFQPGVASTVVRVAHDVQGANAVIRTAESAAGLAGPALAGVLVGFSSAGVVFAVHAATYLTSGLCLILLRLAPAPPREAAASGGTTFRADLHEGWREFRARTWMWAVILVWMVYTLCVMGPYIPLAAGQIVTEHGAGAYGLVNSALGAGTAAGALLAMRLRAERPLRAGSFGIFAVALMPASVGLDLPVPALCGCLFVAGIGWAFWGVNWATSVQTQVPGDILNRIHAYEVAGSVAMFPVGQALAGPAAAVFGARHVLQAGGVFALAVGSTLLAIPAVRGLRRAAPGKAR